MKLMLQRDCAQLSPQWWSVKRGRPSSSSFDRIITPAKGDYSSQAEDYQAELIGDIVCQNPEYFTQQGRPINNYAIQNGIDTEPLARRWLAHEAELDVVEVGCCFTDDLSFCCSPDGVVGLQPAPEPDGEIEGVPYYSATTTATVELKCPLPKTQASYLLKGRLPPEYKPQVHGHLVVTGAQYVEFVSYSPTLAPLRIRVEADEYTDKLRKALERFQEEYAAARKLLIGGQS